MYKNSQPSWLMKVKWEGGGGVCVSRDAECKSSILKRLLVSFPDRHINNNGDTCMAYSFARPTLFRLGCVVMSIKTA